MSPTIYLKLGGSLITDKTAVQAARKEVIARLAAEIAAARNNNPGLRLLLGHGSGSFGHVTAARYGTRNGVAGKEGWAGFVAVRRDAARLNQLVLEALDLAGVPAVPFPPSAIAVCENGRLQSCATEPLQRLLDAAVVPVLYGDVAVDRLLGGTIVSTEEIMIKVAESITPDYLLLAGETEGVFDLEKSIIPVITPANIEQYHSALGGSRGTDVTGGMISKVEAMLQLVQQYPALTIRIFSGLKKGNLQQLLLDSKTTLGTAIRAVQ